MGIGITEKLLYLFIILIPFMKVPSLPLLGQKAQYSELVFLALLGIWLVRIIRGKDIFREVPLKLSVVCMLLMFIFSFVHSDNWLISGIEYSGILYLALLYLLLIQLVSSQELWWRLVKCWCIVSLFITITGISAYLLSSIGGYHNFLMASHDCYKNADQQLVYRLCSVFRHPAMLAIYLHASMVFGLVLTAGKKNRKEGVWGYVVVILCFIAALLTKTRDNAGIALTLFLALAFIPKRNIFISAARYLSFVYAFSLMVAVIILTVWWIIPVHIERDAKGQKLSIELNTAHPIYHIYHREALHMMKDYPWAGVGLGMFYYKSAGYVKWQDVKRSYHVIFPDIKEEQEDRWKGGSDPHSLYLGAGAETGLLGLGGLLFFLIQMSGFFIKKIIHEKDTRNKYIMQIFLAGLAGFLFNGFYVDMLSVRVFWLLMAMGVIYIITCDRKGLALVTEK